MLTLIQNEVIKIFRRPGIIVMIGLLLVMVIGTGAMTKYNVSQNVYGLNWKEQLQAENDKLSKDVKRLPKSYLAAENFKETIVLNKYRIDHDIKPNSSINAWTFVKSAKPILSFAGLFTIIIAASIVSSEFSWGTIKLIMIRPSSRSQVLLAKYLTVLLFSLLMIAILFVSSLLLGLILFGFSGHNIQLTYRDGGVIEENMVWYLIKYYLLSSVGLWLTATMAFMISTVFRNNSLALGISLFAYFTGDMVTRIIASKFEWAKYILFANTDLNMYTSGSVLVKGMTPTFSVIILSIYMAVFLTASFVSFTKRDIAS